MEESTNSVVDRIKNRAAQLVTEGPAERALVRGNAVISRRRERLAPGPLSPTSMHSSREAESKRAESSTDQIVGDTTPLHSPDRDPTLSQVGGVGFARYVEADISRFPTVDQLRYELDGVIHPMVLEIIEIESPVHFETVMERLRDRYDMGRAGEPTRERVLRSIERLAASRADLRMERVDAASDLFLSFRERPVVPRSPGLHGTRRIFQIAPAELHAGVLACLALESSAYRDDLIRITRDAFGYRRSGPDIYAALDRAIDDLRRSDDIVESWGHLKLRSG